MRLLNTSSPTLFLEEFNPSNIPAYAILSHRWNDQELSFQDIDHLDVRIRQKSGYEKVKRFCERAGRDGYMYAWVDTCCINKQSSTELSEAINSMFKWYQNAWICYTYLNDVASSGTVLDQKGLHAQLQGSKWFTRGWTLQELIASQDLLILDVNWVDIGYKKDMCSILHCITGIDEAILRGTAKLEKFSIAKRMSWAANRQTTRPEDIAYSLMGIFNVNMPLIYGEGEKAFLRLQEEIIKNSDDHTIFAWERETVSYNNPSGFLAHAPAGFRSSGGIVPTRTTYNKPFDVMNGAIRLNVGVTCLQTIMLPCRDTARGNQYVSVGIIQNKEKPARHYIRVDPRLTHHRSYWSFKGTFRNRHVPLYVAKD